MRFDNGITQLTGKSEDDLIDELNGVIFLDPVYGDWQTADEYLSGNVRQKLREAENAAVDSPGYGAVTWRSGNGTSSLKSV